jgi:hypothetical protein
VVELLLGACKADVDWTGLNIRTSRTVREAERWTCREVFIHVSEKGRGELLLLLARLGHARRGSRESSRRHVMATVRAFVAWRSSALP